MPEDEIRRIFAKNLRDMMRDRGLAQKDIAKICGVSTSSVSTWCKGINIPRMDKIEMLAQYFGVEKSDLIESKREQKVPEGVLQLKRIPLLGRIAAGAPIYAEENIEGYTYTDLNGGHEYFGLRVHGDSMDAAGIRDGYTVIVRRQDVVEEGQIAVCLIEVGHNSFDTHAYLQQLKTQNGSEYETQFRAFQQKYVSPEKCEKR